jgi:site-specific DNA recombinase
VQRQRADCLEYCESRSWEVVGVYEDNDMSAYSGKPRKAYRAVCRALKDGSADALVVWHPDRLHRSPKELESFIDLIEATGALVASVSAGDFDLATPEGRLTARITGSVARKESEDKSRRLRRKMVEIAEAGGWHGGTRAFGYANDGITPVAEEADRIRDAAARILAGGSCRSIAADWNGAGVLSPRGNHWVPQVIRKVLLSPRVRGLREHRGEIVGQAAWPAILDEETAAAVTAVLTNPARISNGGVVGRKNFLAGFVYCGNCHNQIATAKVNKADAMSCKTGKYPTSCGRLTVKLEPLQELVRNIAIERLLMASKALAKTKATSAAPKADTTELDGYRARLNELDELFVEGAVTKAQFARMKNELESRQEKALARIADAADSYVWRTVPTTREALEAAWDTQGVEYCSALVGLVFDRITVMPAAHRGARFSGDRVVPKFRDWST